MSNPLGQPTYREARRVRQDRARRPGLVLTLALVTSVSAPGGEMTAAAREGRPITPGEAAGLADVFVPSPAGADHVVTLRVQRGWGPPGSDTHVVTRRGDWLRIDEVTKGSASTRYLGLVDGVMVHLSRNPAGGYSYIQIDTRADMRPEETDYHSFRTGETDVVLGEPCEVWETYRRRSDEAGRGGLTRSGCITADGIELWRRWVSGRFGVLSSAEAVRVERRSVEAGEVRPPDDLLSLEGWFGARAVVRDAVPAGQADFDLVLARDGRLDEPAMTVRRRHPWRYEDRYGEGKPRHLSIWREDRATRLDLYVGVQGAPERLGMADRPLADQPRVLPVPLPEPPEVVLGERCAWVDLTPDITDVRRHECQTRDGIPLRIRFWNRAWREGYSAVDLTRRPVEFAEVMPAPELLDRSGWRLAE
jgi:hypothetical protein